MAEDLLAARGLVVAYGRGSASLLGAGKLVPVLHGVDIRVGRGETVGIVGESGSGKTTLGRALLGLVEPVAGTVTFDGADITALGEQARRPLRRRMQMIFQDPMSSLNPRHTMALPPAAKPRSRWCTACSIASDCLRQRSIAIRSNCPAASASASA
jgi:ABC-type glutathione transport system ATPase component